jgi:hypothetical protein
MSKKFYLKSLSYVLIFCFTAIPVLTHAVDPYDPNVDDPEYDMGSVYNNSQGDYSGISDLRKAVRDPAAAQSLTSCSKAVPAVQRAVLGLQYAKQDPTRNDTLLTIFNNIPALVGGVKAIDKAYITNTKTDSQGNKTTETVLSDDAKKQWRSFGSGVANTVTFGASGNREMQKAIKAGDTDRLTELAEQETFRTECLDSIKISIATNLLDRGTNEMISLVQTGNFGNPMYITSGKQWYKDMQNQTLMDVFGTDLTNRQNGLDMSNPYAMGTIKNIIDSTRGNTLQEKGLYTLSDVLVRIQNNYGTGNGINNIAPDAITKRNALNAYKKDFSQGGWEAWLSLTQNPANNPIGYSILAQQELSRQEDINTKAEEAENNPQLLSKKVCVRYKNDQGEEINKKNTKIDPSDKIKCLESEVVTPGSFITERMKWFITSDVRQLELANKFNSSISSIMTASINRATQIGLDKIQTRLSNQWSSNGLNSSLGQYSANRKTFMNGGSKTNVTYKGKSYELFLDTSSSYWKQNLDLNRDLNDVQIGCEVKKGLYNNQKEYVEELEYMVDSNTSPLPKIIPYVALLDMCVPGPTAIWQDLSDPVFADYVEAVSSDDSQKLGSPDLAFTKIKEVLVKKEKTSGTLNSIGSLTSSIAPMLPPPANGIGMIVGAGLNITSAIVKNSKVGGLKPGDWVQGINAFERYIPMALEVEATENKDNEINTTITAYENMVAYFYERYSDKNNLPVAAKSRTVIGNLIEKNENINATMQAYKSEYDRATVVLGELESIKKETDAIYSAARSRMSAKYDIKDSAGKVVQKWDEVPAICTQSCSVVRKPIEKPTFDSVDMLIAGMKLSNGVWSSGSRPINLVGGVSVDAPAGNDQIDPRIIQGGLSSGGSGTGGGSTTGSGSSSNSNPTNSGSSSANSLLIINPPKIVYFTPDSTSVSRGDSVSLSWVIEKMKGGEYTISTSRGAVVKSVKNSTVDYIDDSLELNPTTNTTYILNARNNSVDVSARFTVTVF